jgi:hypothetical protein
MDFMIYLHVKIGKNDNDVGDEEERVNEGCGRKRGQRERDR